MSFTVVIPARHASVRLPGKPLLDIAGKPMIQRVYEQAVQSGADHVIIATDHQEIAERVSDFGGECLMTSADHQSGTDRLQEVALQLQLPGEAIIVNVQGDEPLIPPAVINQVAENLAAHPEAAIATLCEPLQGREQIENPNVVKVVMDSNGLALYFSRSPIPFDRDRAGSPEGFTHGHWFRHIGIYAYRVSLLHQFVQWPVAPLEQTEKLEQLRAMWNGERIHVALSDEEIPGGVDTEEDLLRVISEVNKRD